MSRMKQVLIICCLLLVCTGCGEHVRLSTPMTPEESAYPTASPSFLICKTVPSVAYEATGVPMTSLPRGATTTVHVSPGDHITVKFFGPCASGGILMLASRDNAHDFTDVGTGSMATWTVTDSDSRLLEVAWTACAGAVSCPAPTTLGTIATVARLA